MATKKYVMLVDSERCVNCKACVTSCRAEWNTPLGFSRNWVSEVVKENDSGVPQISFLSGRCMHCDDPPCVPVCPTGASYKRDDGIVLVDRDTCIGCELCVDPCPYDARFSDPADGMISKCTFCQPRIDAGEEPACVHVCFTRALIFGDANDPNSEVSELLNQGSWKSLVTGQVDVGPNLYYSENTVFDEAVLPKEKKTNLVSLNLKNEVNQPIKIGLGSMLCMFGVAGFQKLIKRKEEVSSHE